MSTGARPRAELRAEAKEQRALARVPDLVAIPQLVRRRRALVLHLRRCVEERLARGGVAVLGAIEEAGMEPPPAGPERTAEVLLHWCERVLRDNPKPPPKKMTADRRAALRAARRVRRGETTEEEEAAKIRRRRHRQRSGRPAPGRRPDGKPAMTKGARRDRLVRAYRAAYPPRPPEPPEKLSVFVLPDPADSFACPTERVPPDVLRAHRDYRSEAEITWRPGPDVRCVREERETEHE
jgi:hypothetical protein